jgi:hypothetical protein
MEDGGARESVYPELDIAAPNGMSTVDFAAKVMAIARSYCNCVGYYLPALTISNHMAAPWAYNSNSLAVAILNQASGGYSYSGQISSYLRAHGAAAPGLNNPVPDWAFE